MTRPPLDLSIEVSNYDGTRYRWGPNEPPASRPRGLQFRSKIGEGFSDASLNLPRRIDLDYPDLRLAGDVTVVGSDGTTAYEGRIAATPRELGDAHSITVQAVGWMAHAKDKKFQEIYVDRDLSAWGAVSRGRRASLLTNNFSVYDSTQATDAVDSTAGVELLITGAWASPFQPVSEAWYDAGGGLTVGKVAYQWKKSGGISGVAPWQWWVILSTDDKATTTQNSGNLVGAGPGAGTLTATAATYRYAVLQLLFASTPAGADGAQYALDWYKLAVYGNHGLPTITGEPGEPGGVYASDVIRDIVARWCPQLDPSGVQSTTYVIQHLAFKDRTYPYDAFLEVNKYHLWHLGVWEDRTLYFRPYNLAEYDWEIRSDDDGTTISLQGDSTDDVYNGIVVTYDDLLTGVRQVLRPDQYGDLRDTDPENPWNQWGVDHWFEDLTLSSPTLQAQALQIGRMVLASKNAPKAPGTITVRGYIKDRNGSDQPVWKVRAGQTISITNYPNDRPRLIHEASYDDESKTVTLSIDAPAAAVDALFDRLASGLQARGLT